MGALHLCPPVCPLRRDAGRRRVAGLAQSFLDCGLHGDRALRRDGLQPLGGCPPGRCQSENRSARDSRRFAKPQLCRRLYRGYVAGLCPGCGAIEPGDAPAFSRGSRGAPALLLHQEVHPLVSPGARPGVGHRSRSRLDRDPRLSGSAHRRAHRGSAVSGWGDSMFSTPARTWRTTGKTA